jgi:hypothetical protein
MIGCRVLHCIIGCRVLPSFLHHIIAPACTTSFAAVSFPLALPLDICGKKFQCFFYSRERRCSLFQVCRGVMSECESDSSDDIRIQTYQGNFTTKVHARVIAPAIDRD